MLFVENGLWINSKGNFSKGVLSQNELSGKPSCNGNGSQLVKEGRSSLLPALLPHLLKLSALLPDANEVSYTPPEPEQTLAQLPLLPSSTVIAAVLTLLFAEMGEAPQRIGLH